MKVKELKQLLEKVNDNAIVQVGYDTHLGLKDFIIVTYDELDETYLDFLTEDPISVSISVKALYGKVTNSGVKTEKSSNLNGNFKKIHDMVWHGKKK